MWLLEKKGQLSQTGVGMRALFQRCSGMRANQRAAVVYIASSLFCRSSGSAGSGRLGVGGWGVGCGILSGIDVLCVCREGGMTNDLSEVDFLAKI